MDVTEAGGVGLPDRLAIERMELENADC